MTSSDDFLLRKFLYPKKRLNELAMLMNPSTSCSIPAPCGKHQHHAKECSHPLDISSLQMDLVTRWQKAFWGPAGQVPFGLMGLLPHNLAGSLGGEPKGQLLDLMTTICPTVTSVSGPCSLWTSTDGRSPDMKEITYYNGIYDMV